MPPLPPPKLQFTHRRRTPRAPFLVGFVALATAVVVLALGFKTTDAVPPGIPRGADQVTVTGKRVSRPVAPGFVGLSLEYTAVEKYAGTNPKNVNPVFVKLMDDLAPGGRPVLRIGGDTSDWGWFNTPGLVKPLGIRYTLGPNWVSVTRTLAARADARLILGLNLEANSPLLMATQVRAFRGLGRRALTGLEIGNEPEVFGALGWYQTAPHHPVFARPRSYHFNAFTREFARYSRIVPADIPLVGPTTGSTRFWAKTGTFLTQHPRVRTVTFHLYPLHECLVDPHGPVTPSIPHLLAPSSSTGLAALVAPYVPVAHAHGAQVRIDELNSVSCGGGPGVSDRFVSALWAIDTMFALAREGVDGVNFHTFKHAYYRPFLFRHPASGWNASVAPMYYGMLAFVRAAPAGSVLLQTGSPPRPDLRVWATRSRDGHVRVMLINTSLRRPRTVAIKLPQSSGSAPPTLQRLTAPSLHAAQGVSLGGQHFAHPTRTGQLVGRPVQVRPRQVGQDAYVVRMPAASAAILTR